MNQRQIIFYYRNKKKIGAVVLDHVKKKKYVVYGSHSLNNQLPPYLRKPTSDYDILVPKNPRKVARKIERKLDKKFKGNFFKTKQAKYPKTSKVVTTIGEETIADITKGSAPFVKRKGIRYSSLDYEKQNVRKSLKDPKSSFRHPKDKERLLRMNLARKRIIKRKRRPTGLIQRSKNLIPSSISFGRFKF